MKIEIIIVKTEEKMYKKDIELEIFTVLNKKDVSLKTEYLNMYAL